MFHRSLTLAQSDPELFRAIAAETERQESHIELIASENYASPAVLAAQGSQLTNKYAEGYPGKRYYGGCEYVDVAEQLAIDRVKKIFGAECANVQPHSGAQANQAVFMATLSPGDTILGMSLPHGGHLTHGSPVNMSGKWFKVVAYGLEPETELIDYAAAERLAHEHKPQAHHRRRVGVFAGHRLETLPGDRRCGRRDVHGRHGALCRTDRRRPLSQPRRHRRFRDQHHAQDAARPARRIRPRRRPSTRRCSTPPIFPGLQGGPLMHVIAAKAVAFGEALHKRFQALSGAGDRQRAGVGQGPAGTRTARRLRRHRFAHVAGRPARQEDHRPRCRGGARAAPTSPSTRTRSRTIRKSRSSPPASASAAPAMTTRGFTEIEAEEVAHLIVDVLDAPGDEATIARARGERRGADREISGVRMIAVAGGRRGDVAAGGRAMNSDTGLPADEVPVLRQRGYPGDRFAGLGRRRLHPPPSSLPAHARSASRPTRRSNCACRRWSSKRHRASNSTSPRSATASSARCTSDPCPPNTSTRRSIASSSRCSRSASAKSPRDAIGEMVMAGALQARQGRLHPLRVGVSAASRTSRTSVKRSQAQEALNGRSARFRRDVR